MTLRRTLLTRAGMNGCASDLSVPLTLRDLDRIIVEAAEATEHATASSRKPQSLQRPSKLREAEAR
eukprot:7244009-Pyramimonas_sp.AAC.1